MGVIQAVHGSGALGMMWVNFCGGFQMGAVLQEAVVWLLRAHDGRDFSGVVPCRAGPGGTHPLVLMLLET